MGSVFTLDSEQSMEMLNCAIGQRIPAIMSYMSKNKWHVAKVVMVKQSDRSIHLETMHQGRRQQPLNIQIGQPVGVSFKHAYAKFVYDTAIQALMPCTDPSKGGTIVVARPDKIEAIQRRSYFRVNVPRNMKVNVVIWHRSGRRMPTTETPKCYSGQLMDLSAGGAQIAIPLVKGEAGQEKLDFHQGQFIGIRFTPLPYEMPLIINAQIRTILPTADENAVCIGLQLVGLEASQEGRETLTRIAQVVETYFQMNEEPADAFSCSREGCHQATANPTSI